jgi:RNA ligase
MTHIDLEALKPYREQGLITSREHPDGGLWIHNYTQRCQYTRAWDEVTRMCRGLITDATGRIVARPFRKFFNLEEHTPEEIAGLADKPFTITRKLDGSLGIGYLAPDGQLAIATRGSFTSEQAQWATRYIRTHYPDFCNETLTHTHYTYLFEIIYTDNKVVVDYKGFEGLIVLTVVHTETGEEVGDDFLPVFVGLDMLPVVDRIEAHWQSLPQDLVNEEGYVIAFHHTTPPTRIKVKLAEYVRLHRLLTKLNDRGVWECLKNGDSLDTFLENVPDEFYQWVRGVESRLKAEYERIEAQCHADFAGVPFGSRKEQALYITRCAHPPILFKILDQKPYAPVIWKLIEPEQASGFTREGSEDV